MAGGLECAVKGERTMTKSAGKWASAILGGVILAQITCFTGCAALQQSQYGELPTVDYVDLSRYAGKWYEIARYPNDFEKGCQGVTARYLPRSDEQLAVINTCRSEAGDITDRIEGTARVDDWDTNAKLKVTFFWPFAAPYWIIDLGEDYEYAVVGEPRREFFWILSRTPQMDQEQLDQILDRMPDWGYDPERLYFVPHPEE